jgi:hypothetical protein
MVIHFNMVIDIDLGPAPVGVGEYPLQYGNRY